MPELPEPTGVLSWVNRGEGLVGWGEAARFTPSGADRFEAAHRWWTSFTGSAVIDDEVGVRGTGPVAFVTLAFDDGSDESVIVVPKVTLGRRDGVSWITTVGDPLPPRRNVGRSGAVRYNAGFVAPQQHLRAVSAAVARLQLSGLDKVVLARDLIATTQGEIDERLVLSNLAAANRDSWVFAVDGLLGATPELLLGRDGNQVTSRVLAGTVWRTSDVDDDSTLARRLRGSGKDRAEHAYAVDSLVESLAGDCTSLDVDAQPSVLHLPTVSHFATQVRGRLASDLSVLQLAGHVHPTAAVCGSPRAAALQAISDLELMSRGRYLGPVGWIDADGNGEFGIALRCGLVHGRTARLFAGGGILASSDPQSELDETNAKLRPMQQALEDDLREGDS